MASNTLDHSASLRERVSAAGTCEAKVLSSSSEASSQITRATTELHQAHDTVSTRDTELVRTAQLKMSIKSLEDNVEFYEGSEVSLKIGFATVTTESINFGQLFDSTRAEVVDFQKKLISEDFIARFIVEDSCATLG